MKKTKTMLMIMVTIVMFTGCGKEAKVTEKREIMTERIEVEETETERYISDEYLEEMEYNSKSNVYPNYDDDYEYETGNFDFYGCKAEYTIARKDGVAKEMMIDMIVEDIVFEYYEDFKEGFENGFNEILGHDRCKFTWAEETSFGLNVVTCYITDIEY